jgi:hypothetical protein
MKNKNSFLKLALVSVTFLAFAGCNSDDASTTPSPGPGPVAQNQNPSTPTPAPVATPVPTPRPRNTPVPPRETRVMNGVWGGNEIAMTVNLAGASIDLGCSKGVSSPLILDNRGSFNAIGTLTVRKPGPVAQGQTIPTYRAQYTGTEANGLMELSITYYIGNRVQPQMNYTLRFGSASGAHACPL